MGITTHVLILVASANVLIHGARLRYYNSPLLINPPF